MLPPGLRCLQIQGNNVVLNWITPANSSTQFLDYEIYHKAPASANYTLAGTINTFSVTSFTHVGSSGGFYYMLTHEIGNQVSKNSDTLRTIFLNVIPFPNDLKFTYNHVRNPKLPTTVNTFTIVKEYPVGVFNNLAVTSLKEYGDTLSVCSANIAYHVIIDDLSGCRSISNRVAGLYYDNKSPNKVEIDSISVLPTGRTILSWFVPRDQDLVKYSIQDNHTPYDTVLGRNSTNYVYTLTTANTGTVSLACSGVDSCKNGGSEIYYDATTIFLRTYYNYCAYRTELTWTPYLWHPERIQEYRIFYSENGSPFKQVGSTKQTSFLHEGVSPGKNVCYFIRMVSLNNGPTSSSNRKCFFTTQVSASGSLYIRTANVLSKNSVNINIYLDNSKPSNGIELYRSDDGQAFSNIGFVPFDGSSNYNYTDVKAESNLKSYVYKAVVKDSCGNPRTVSNLVKTILLKVEDDKEKIFTKHLTWNDYSGFGGGVSGYKVYRIINDIAETNALVTTNASTNFFTDNLEQAASMGSKIEYLVQAIEAPGNTWGFKEVSNSNSSPVYVEGRIFVPTAFAPYGANKTWLPVTHFIDKNEYRVRVYNRWGKKVFETNTDTQAWDGANCLADIYVYLITYKNSRGEYQEAKGTVMLLE